MGSYQMNQYKGIITLYSYQKVHMKRVHIKANESKSRKRSHEKPLLIKGRIFVPYKQ